MRNGGRKINLRQDFAGGLAARATPGQLYVLQQRFRPLG
jgi:hypothetical protein